MKRRNVDFAQHQIVVRDGKGEQDRVTVLPDSLVAPLQEHLQRVKQLHERDLDEGHGTVDLPYALERKYPNANKEWGWQYVFPSERLSADPRTGHTHRLTCTCAASAGVTWTKAVCKKLWQANYDIRTVQELLGHKDVKTTMTRSVHTSSIAAAWRPEGDSPLD